MIVPTGDSCELDDATASLIFQLQLQDLEELSKRSKGKQREDAPADDFTLAASLYRAELASTISTISDSKMSRSIANAVRSDGELISAFNEQEHRAAADRQVALRLAKDKKAKARNNTDVPGPAEAECGPYDAELLDKFAAMYLFGEGDDDVGGTRPESSSWAAGRASTGTTKNRRDCVICLEKFPFHEVARAPCAAGHEYCRGCLMELFSRCLSDESLFPPRCCSEPFRLDSVRVFLSPKLVGEFLARKLEMETPDRTYCHQPSCSAFIPRQFIRHDQGTCPRCQARTCTICKGPPHRGDCPQDPGLQEVLRVAQENGWQRCCSCQRVVELNTGCNHMTCPCGGQFCYVCGARWKTCACPQWNEERLIERAAVVVDREIGRRAVPDRQRNIMVQEVQENLRENHECRHGSWRRIGGPRECEECYHVLPLYINVCRQCQIMVCQRCRLNRL